MMFLLKENSISYDIIILLIKRISYEEEYMADKVVLDALIPREDFDIKDHNTVAAGRSKTTLSIPDLEFESFFFSAIRKPDFQRETNEWDANKIVELVKSFIKLD